MKTDLRKFRGLVQRGYSKSYVRKQFKSIPIKTFNERYSKYVTQKSLINRFNKMRMSTILKHDNFKFLKTKRGMNKYVVTYEAKIRNRKFGTSEISTFSIGFDVLISKKEVFELIAQQLTMLVTDSPDIEAEFIKIINMGKKQDS